MISTAVLSILTTKKWWSAWPEWQWSTSSEKDLGNLKYHLNWGGQDHRKKVVNIIGTGGQDESESTTSHKL